MRRLIFYASFFYTIFLFAQKQFTKEEYIQKYKDIAIAEMHKYGIPASVTLAQGILESGWGNSPLSANANNHFGIKCHTTWEGPIFVQDDDEKDECFRKYESPWQSFRDHSEFLKTRSRYESLFELKKVDYKGWAHGLKKAGYATNPKYPQLLIGLIEEYQLHEYDLVPQALYASANEHNLIIETTSNYKSTQKESNDYEEETIILEEFKDTKQKNLQAERNPQLSNNNIKYIRVRKGDTFYGLAHEFDVRMSWIMKYNDMSKGHVLKEGEILYLQPKRNKAKQQTYIFKDGDSMFGISQQYGVKLKKIYRKNKLVFGSEPKVGTKLKLR